jgi:putative hemolysin
MEEMNEHCIYVDPFNNSSSHTRNISGLRRAIEHLRGGGLLAIFPAGEVSHWRFGEPEVTDPEWNATTARFVRLTGAPVIPAFFAGRNSNFFQAVGLVHSRLRTIQLPREFLNSAGKEIELRFGSIIPAEKIKRITNDVEATQFLRWRTYLLRSRRQGESTEDTPNAASSGDRTVAASRGSEIALEIENLSPLAVLSENRDFKVVVAAAGEIPQALQEIGRQREIAFRLVGEGTGLEIDLDEFDRHYQQLILWSKKDLRIAGGYRFTNTAEALRLRGPAGLYTNKLFWIHPDFFSHMGPLLELGRSFICREYQRQYAPLLMMWSAIGRYVALHPETPVLFGPVSISRTYSQTSRELLVRFFEAQHFNPLSQWIRPRKPFRSRPVSEWEWQAIRCLLDLDEISSSIAEIESDRKGVPVLLRQYLKMGGELLAFNVDRTFSDVLDGLILVDLRKADAARLETYMGKIGLQHFRDYHSQVPTC